MSEKVVETILSRAMSDAKFAEALFTDPEKTLSGFELTADELDGVKGMSRENFSQFSASSPEERKSMSWFRPINHNQTGLTIR